MYQFGFEKLAVWQLSRKFVTKIYKITYNFSDEEKYCLVGQMRRATISISSNLAEGSSRFSSKDQLKFYQYSYSSLMEVMNQLIHSSDLMFISNDQLNQLREDVHELSKVINSLSKSAKERIGT